MRRKSGFTLIELLVVIAIIAILAAILFPVFAKGRSRERTDDCRKNLKTAFDIIKQYAEEHDGKLPRAGQSLSPLEVIRKDYLSKKRLSDSNWVFACTEAIHTKKPHMGYSMTPLDTFNVPEPEKTVLLGDGIENRPLSLFDQTVLYPHCFGGEHEEGSYNFTCFVTLDGTVHCYKEGHIPASFIFGKKDYEFVDRDKIPPGSTIIQPDGTKRISR